jgi:sortase (surface protein transpeptidase)
MPATEHLLIKYGRAVGFALAGVVAVAAACVALPSSNVDAATPTGRMAAISAPARVEVDALAAAVRLTAPAPQVASEAPVLPAVINRSSCRSDLPGAMATITIADISYSCPVYAGGQSMLDSGAVTLDDDLSSPYLATHPGQAGTLWIAAHRTSHGGAFAAVPSLADGALVVVSAGSTTATYRVVARAYVSIVDDLVVDTNGQPSHAATVDSILRTDRGGGNVPRLLLQTCDGTDHRWMIYADLVA